MAEEFDQFRRTLLAGLAALPLAGVAGAAGAAPRETPPGNAASLVVYFSRSGNTRVVAGLFQRAMGADIFELQPATPYPADYLQTVAQAKRETDAGFEPALSAMPSLGKYQTIFLGFPIWGTTAPPVIRSFLHANRFAGKTIVPFITHGGYGTGDSLSVIANHAPGARFLQGFSMQADQERKTMERVNTWIAGSGMAS